MTMGGKQRDIRQQASSNFSISTVTFDRISKCSEVFFHICKECLHKECKVLSSPQKRNYSLQNKHLGTLACMIHHELLSLTLRGSREGLGTPRKKK